LLFYAGGYRARPVASRNARLRVQLAERDVALAVAAAQIEALKFNLAVLKRRQFGQSSEKLAAEIEQLELRLEDLEESRAEQGRRIPSQSRNNPSRPNRANRHSETAATAPAA
jgi:transposase